MSAPATAALNTTVHNFNPTVFHYFKKADITRGLVLGAKERALCGIRRQVGVLPSHTLSKGSGAAICPLCQMTMDTLKAGKR